MNAYVWHTAIMSYNTWHRDLMGQYYQARDVWELRAEAASIGYATELAAYAEEHPRPQLKQFMIGFRLNR